MKTTIETLPITEITFPKVTVCPPKNTYTDLNYDLMMTDNMTLGNDTRNELTNYAFEIINDHLYELIMKNLSMLEDNDRFYNWYQGYTNIDLPTRTYGSNPIPYSYYVHTYATSGTISTQYFGDEFDADKVETNMMYRIVVYPPDSVKWNSNVSLHFVIEKISMKNLLTGYETYDIKDVDKISMDITHIREGERQFSLSLCWALRPIKGLLPHRVFVPTSNNIS